LAECYEILGGEVAVTIHAGAPLERASSRGDAERWSLGSYKLRVGLPLISLSLAGLVLADLLFVETGLSRQPDRALEGTVHGLFGPPWYGFMEAVSNVAGGKGTLLLLASLVGLLAVCRRWLEAVVAVVAVAGASLLDAITKSLVGRPRPHLFPHVVQAGGASFPSGHATDAGALAAVAIYVVWRMAPNRVLAGLMTTLLFISAGLIGLSRVALGVHYPSDVLAGWALAGAWTALVIRYLVPAVRAIPSQAAEEAVEPQVS
jgi:undecaprenyl-diphosphatase